MKGYGYVEFEVDKVAQIAAESMNNYLMFKRLLKGKYTLLSVIFQWIHFVELLILRLNPCVNFSPFFKLKLDISLNYAHPWPSTLELFFCLFVVKYIRNGGKKWRYLKNKENSRPIALRNRDQFVKEQNKTKSPSEETRLVKKQRRSLRRLHADLSKLGIDFEFQVGTLFLTFSL